MIAELEFWAMKTWHNAFGHPRPWRVLEQGMFCGRCGEEIKSF